MNNTSQSSQNLNNKDLSQTDAIKVLIRAVQVAQEKGCYTLDEAALVHQAVSKFIVPNSQDMETIKENTSENTINNTSDINEQ